MCSLFIYIVAFFIFISFAHILRSFQVFRSLLFSSLSHLRLSSVFPSIGLFTDISQRSADVSDIDFTVGIHIASDIVLRLSHLIDFLQEVFHTLFLLCKNCLLFFAAFSLLITRLHCFALTALSVTLLCPTDRCEIL